MPPTLILIRHAQALHNATSDWSIHDPPLTDLGRQQSAELHESLKANDLANKTDLIVVSPMRRTLETMTIGLDWLIKKGVPVHPDANWHENADKPCDTGNTMDVIGKEYPQYDFSGVDPLYPDKTTNLATNPYAFTQKAIVARGQTCLKDLYSRPEKVIAVVSHSGFLRTAVCERSFFNADWRVFDFDDVESQKQGKFVLKEWELTEKKGGGMGRSDVGVFGIVDGDFPPETEDVKTQPQLGEVGEASKQVPEKKSA
ncbi:histidine phosphatase superfamily [Boeremia exigua]|uniref:histidine phosphatase superfamily n=1 Tax=Boeremia exigua TaxID=749465 RepID=UPI001E8CCB69|nr:histidine phosphatase superfamily [Boeremia exigua]KAH6629771.1 histidine phosphatase superfamily [Boeremia exigua]